MTWTTIKTLYTSHYFSIALLSIGIFTSLNEMIGAITSIFESSAPFSFGFYLKIFLLAAFIFIVFCLLARFLCPEVIRKFSSQAEVANFLINQRSGGVQALEEHNLGNFQRAVDNLFSRFRRAKSVKPGTFQPVDGVGKIATRALDFLTPRGRLDKIEREYQIAASNWRDCNRLYPAKRFFLTLLFSVSALLYVGCFIIPRFLSIFFPDVSSSFSIWVTNMINRLFAS